MSSETQACFIYYTCNLIALVNWIYLYQFSFPFFTLPVNSSRFLSLNFSISLDFSLAVFVFHSLFWSITHVLFLPDTHDATQGIWLHDAMKWIVSKAPDHNISHFSFFLYRIASGPPTSKCLYFRIIWQY